MCFKIRKLEVCDYYLYVPYFLYICYHDNRLPSFLFMLAIRSTDNSEKEEQDEDKA